jgi:hypothetical protein
LKTNCVPLWSLNSVSPCGSNVINCICIFCEQVVVAAAGAEGKGGERMLFIHWKLL